MLERGANQLNEGGPVMHLARTKNFSPPMAFGRAVFFVAKAGRRRFEARSCCSLVLQIALEAAGPAGGESYRVAQYAWKVIFASVGGLKFFD